MGEPTISAGHPVCRALHNGTTLQMLDTVPMTRSTAAVGRPVGALVDTGRADIDIKRIMSVEILYGEMPDGMSRPNDRCTHITIDPELGTHINVPRGADCGVTSTCVAVMVVSRRDFQVTLLESAFAGRNYPVAARRSWKTRRSIL
jgi:hypothetical protein